MDIIQSLNQYKQGVADHSWKTSEKIAYENEYITLVSINSSNRWISSSEMQKQWSIIVIPKKEFSSLTNYKFLSSKKIISITPVLKGENKGCLGIRLYGMKRDPDAYIIKMLLDFIFEEVRLTDEEHDIIFKMSEEELETVLELEDISTGYIYHEGLNKIRKLNYQVISKLKDIYKGTCQLCDKNVGADFGKEIVQAHHIEYFSRTQNNNPSNIIILCPNCHALIHKCEPKYDKESLSFVFDNGMSFSIITPGHLKKD